MNPDTEHFCTLFDKNYLPLGMALHSSLMTHSDPFHLWILCMDDVVEDQLQKLALPNVTLIPLKAVETPDLLAIKSGRSQGEYCWTMTPFTFQMVFDRSTDAQRVTYLDADLFFFDKPGILLDELTNARKHVLITEHAYAPEYDQAEISGRFCVQFVTFTKTHEALEVLKKWQEQCLEWCFNKVEPSRFGDQKYLDFWPEDFDKAVHICQQPEKTLAPWNVAFYSNKSKKEICPVFYHFHGLRIVSPRLIRLYTKYRVGQQGKEFYIIYNKALTDNLNRIASLQFPIPYLPIFKNEALTLLRYIKQIVFRETSFMPIKKQIS